jgi:hypothetical protein
VVADDATSRLSRRDLLVRGTIATGAAALGLRAPGAQAAPASATEVRFDQLDGVPLTFWRFRDGSAGTRAVHQTFAATRLFHERLLRWIVDLKVLAERHAGLVGMNRIVTAGIFVDKPGQHGLGQAIDLDEVRWENGTISPYAREHLSPDRRTYRRYLALQAVCRRHFRWVLDGHYNADHADHLHMDFGGGNIVCGRDSRSDTVFVQQVLNSHQHAGLAIDGRWGRATDRAFEESCRRLLVEGDCHTWTPAWRYWLLRAASCSFADVDFAAAPLPELDPLRDLVDDLVGPAEDVLLELLGLLQG